MATIPRTLASLLEPAAEAPLHTDVFAPQQVAQDVQNLTSRNHRQSQQDHSSK